MPSRSVCLQNTGKDDQLPWGLSQKCQCQGFGVVHLDELKELEVGQQRGATVQTIERTWVVVDEETSDLTDGFVQTH